MLKAPVAKLLCLCYLSVVALCSLNSAHDRKNLDNDSSITIPQKSRLLSFLHKRDQLLSLLKLAAMEKSNVQLSYGRCTLSPSFFDDFYDSFLNSSSEVRKKFKDTDMQTQKDLLRHGIAYVIMFANNSKSAEGKLERLGDSHSKHNLDIKPEMYDLWLQSLLDTVRQHDQKITNQLLQDWELTLRKGIEKITSYYLQ